MKKYINKNQRGMVSIIVTLIIMMILTLIVTGFAQLARREQREALDRELSTQAQYAAESGINAAEAKIKINLANNIYTNYDTCNTTSFFGVVSTNNAEPTCILVKNNPDTLVVQRLLDNKSTIMPIIPADNNGNSDSTVDRIIIAWQNKDNGNNIKYSLPLPSKIFTPNSGPSGWGIDNVGILRIDLVPVNSLNSDDLRNNMFTAFLVPATNGIGTVSFNSGKGVAGQGIIVAAKCNSSPLKKCSVEISGLSTMNPTGVGFYARMKSIYNVSDLAICPSIAFSCNTNSSFVKAQSVIDVTARAADVLKRVQVRVNTDPNASGSYTIPEYTLDSAESICKLLTVTPTSTTEPSCP